MKIQNNAMTLSFDSGQFDKGKATAIRTVQDLAEVWKKAPDPADDRVVYHTYGMSSDDTETPQLRFSTTVIEPGTVHGEYFMTRGHFHTNSEREEFMLVLSGTGELVLRDRIGKAWTEPLGPGFTCVIDGKFAHRLVNTGEEPLIVMVVWQSDCGHDYAVIQRLGFGIRLKQNEDDD